MRISDWSSDVCSSDLDAALADGRQDVGHIGGLLAVAHVRLADRQLVLIDENECHGTTPCECRSVALSGVGGPVFGLAAKRAARASTAVRLAGTDRKFGVRAALGGTAQDSFRPQDRTGAARPFRPERQREWRRDGKSKRLN